MTEQNHSLPHADPDADSYDPAASSLAGQVDPAVMAELLSIRSSIDNIDATLVFLLAERFKATQKVGFLKAAHQLPAGDPGRETAQIARLRHLAAEAHLDPAFAEKFLNFIIGEVIRHHEAIAEDHQAAARDAEALEAGAKDAAGGGAARAAGSPAPSVAADA
ncbi:chorismate mutase [Pseudarthrobacter sp. H2]|uniref:chorismate mutase n=1 Tax=Pseudarthrobacter sp. H2 TaxID=3418415 RepID=UPI003CF3F2A3